MMVELMAVMIAVNMVDCMAVMIIDSVDSMAD